MHNNEYLCCGIIFYDSNNNAGLHMIGTISNGRGKGIGTKMTKKLLLEAKANKSEFCVLHASMMGENIYKKLGFEQVKKFTWEKTAKNMLNLFYETVKN